MHEVGFAKGLFFGQYLGNKLLPYPDLDRDPAPSQMVAELRRYCREHIDAAAIDRNAEIPQSVIDGLGRLGVLGRLLAPGVRRRRIQPDFVLPDDRSARRPLRQHGAVRQRPSFDRPAGAGAVRHAGAAGRVAAEAGHAASGSARSP